MFCETFFVSVFKGPLKFLIPIPLIYKKKMTQTERKEKL